MRIKKFFSWVTKPTHLWVFVFFYTILIGLLVQFIFLPYVFPSLHAGDGLIKGLDGTKFHRIALDLTQSIKQNGWGQWEIMPGKQLVSGIAAIFYVLIYPAPWTVLPVNALLNATAVVCLYLIFVKITDEQSLSLIAILPFLLFPSSLLWNAQFHNENYAVPGVILVIHGWVVLLEKRTGQGKPVSAENIIAILEIAIGTVLIGLVREEILSGFVWICVAAGIVAAVISLLLKKGVMVQLIPVVLAAMAMFLVSYSLGDTSTKSTITSTQPYTDGAERTVADLGTSASRSINTWEKTPGLPNFVDAQFQKVAKFRSKFISAWDYAGSNIDTEVTFNNAEEMIRYIPRAAEIAFLSPFPNMWFSEGEKETGKLTRIVSSFEMIIVYLVLTGMPVFLWRARKKPAVWVVLWICTVMLVTYAITIPNVGSLYRFRYPYLMPIVGFGLAGWTWVFLRKTSNLAEKKQS